MKHQNMFVFIMMGNNLEARLVTLSLSKSSLLVERVENFIANYPIHSFFAAVVPLHNCGAVSGCLLFSTAIAPFTFVTLLSMISSILSQGMGGGGGVAVGLRTSPVSLNTQFKQWVNITQFTLNVNISCQWNSAMLFWTRWYIHGTPLVFHLQ